MGEDGLYAALVKRGMSRRAFLQFSAAMAAALALPASYAPRIAEAVGSVQRLPLIWIRAQGCGGNTQAMLRASHPTVSTLLLETISLEYHEAFLAPTGASADLVLTNAMTRFPDGYFAVIEGAIPTGASGAYCLVGGRPVAEGHRPSAGRHLRLLPNAIDRSLNVVDAGRRRARDVSPWARHFEELRGSSEDR